MTNREIAEVFYNWITAFPKIGTRFKYAINHHSQKPFGVDTIDYIEAILDGGVIPEHIIYRLFNHHADPNGANYWEIILQEWGKHYYRIQQKIHMTNYVNSRLAIPKASCVEDLPVCDFGVDYEAIPNLETTNGCDHSTKYINEAGGIKFWYCPKCKQDLGDA